MKKIKIGQIGIGHNHGEGKMLAVLIGFVGIVAINTNIDGISFNIGDALIIAASFCTVFSNVISKKSI